MNSLLQLMKCPFALPDLDCDRANARVISYLDSEQVFMHVRLAVAV